ncbi:MAG: SPFH domain-containing protein [Rhodocyclales bacterium]|nr:SPFH domain-containing protein [Rhodocyclales bacterium]
MFGIGFIKAQPTTYLIQYRGGRALREGVGLSFFYFRPTSSLVAVPVASQDQHFMFELITLDYQAVTVQGQVSFRVAEPRKAALLLDFSLRQDASAYASEDPQKLKARVMAQVEVLAQQAIRGLPLKQALLGAEAVARQISAGLGGHREIASLGLEILDVSVLAIKPTPETARALEAEAREAILKASDEAIYARRNAAVEQERAIRENELDTEVAVEQKKRLIRETQMDAEASLRQRKAELRQADMEADITLEARRKSWVEKNAANSRMLAEAEAYRVASVMAALEKTDPRVVQSLAAVGMQPGQLIAQAFGGIAERAERIGQLNVSPELLRALMPAGGMEAGRGNPA